MKKTLKKGFTIVELVIVIAVVAILAAVLVPTFASLVRKANESKAQIEAKNLITEMLADIITDKEEKADLLVFSHDGSTVYLNGYSASEGRMLKYSGAELAKFTGTDFKAHVNILAGTLVTNGAITEVTGLAADDWRQPAETAKIVANLDAKGDMVVYANYKIVATEFASGESLSHKAYVGGEAYDTIDEAIANCKSGDTIVLANSEERIKFIPEKRLGTTLSNVTFKAASGAKINGLSIMSTSKEYKLALDNITFEGIDFTDQVVVGQSASTNGYSKCTNVTFKGCSFDLENSKEEYPDAIKHGDVSVRGTITEDKESNAYINNLTVENCTFKNVRNAVRAGKARNVVIKNCTVENATFAAFNFGDVAGDITIEGNNVSNANGVLEINTVGNNYSTNNIESNIVIKNNVATNMTCDNGCVFYTVFDNAKSSGKSTYTVTGNSCTYSQTFDEPLNGFRIKSTYGPSKAEFIANTDN